ncbi:MAG TPA: hypothetical protein PLD41_05480 [Casimicrobium huifangae]|nr:hypothetical protein [Casimicrobium huifangae]
MRVLLPALVLVWMQIIASVPLKPRELGWYPTDFGMRLQPAITLPASPRITTNRVDSASLFVAGERRSDRNGTSPFALTVAFVPFLLFFFTVGPWRRLPWDLVAEALRNHGP